MLVMIFVVILVVILVMILTGKSSTRLIHSAAPQLLGCHKRHKPLVEISLVYFLYFARLGDI